jgi:nicotinamidase-related amidase
MFNPAAPVHNHEQLLANLQLLLDGARASKTPVIYVQHCGPDGAPHAPGLPGWEIHPTIAPQPGELVVQKHTPDSFHKTTLRAELDALAIDTLILAGIQSDYCVDTTTRRAFSEGYTVELVADAHGTWGDGDLSAQQIIDHHNRVLGNWFATVKPAAEVVFTAG